jgi:GH15 family glucan-1,4-alpha-glucosidase
LEGYRRSPPVRWGNGAAEQRQHDVFGEIVDCAYQWTQHHGTVTEAFWEKIAPVDRWACMCEERNAP